MQGINPPTPAQLLAAGQVPLMKLEAYVNSNWINICDLSNEKLIDRGLNIWASATDLTHWVEGIAGTSTVNREATEKIEGDYSCRLDVDAGNSLVYIRQTSMPLTPLKRYKLIIWYMNSVAGKTVDINFRDTGSNVYLKPDGTWQAGYINISLPNSLVWKKYELYFYAHADYSLYYLYLKSSGSASSSIYFDNISIQEISPEIGKNYLESVSISLGGASPTPNPIGGTWSAALFNEDGIFHPQHPTSAYAGYCVTGRKVRISIGATYGGVDYYWQRIIGYMDEPKFSAPDYRVNISGGDYMKMLEDAEFQELDATFPNHWGLSTTFDSWPSDGLVGVELYNEADAMDITGEADNVDDWNSPNCDFVSFGDVGGGSVYVGKVTNTEMEASYIENTNVINGNATIGTTYKIVFKYKRVAGSAFPMTAGIYQGAVKIGGKGGLNSDKWESVTFNAVAVAAEPMIMKFTFGDTGQEFRIDQISIWEYLPEEERYYDLTGADANQKGPYHVTYDDGGGAVPVWENETDEGWLYEETTGRVAFDQNKTVIDGTGLANVTIYYFTNTPLEDVLARILWFAQVLDPGTGVPYVNEAAAKAAIVGAPEYADPNVDIDKVWFDAGTTLLNAIRMICERCDYRFYFKHDGTPVFRPKPAPGAAIFTFTSPAHIASYNTYQSWSEIKNRVIIKGIKQADMGVGSEEGVSSELIGEANDAASIVAYGERTLTINNYLFQTQGPLDAMCATLLALYKTPKWYADLKVPFNPVPLELVDDIQWELRLSPVLNITQTGVIRDIKIDKFDTTYKCEKP